MGLRMKKLLLLLVFFSAVVVASPAFALGGCTNTPENPTLVLAGLASGVFGVRQLRNHLRARRAKRSQDQQN
jgi:XrtJ-associated TM-motif-TM protein